MTSFSALGATSITVQFDLNRNIDLAAQDVQVDLRVGICQGVTMALPGKVRAVT
jgi:multidrug efflux pump subunit AcrB